MSERSLEQKRAAHALKAVYDIRKESSAGENKSYAAKFRSYVERLPAAIVMNGLGQAMAGELAACGRAEKNSADEEAPKERYTADEKAHKKLYELVAEWIRIRNIYSGNNQMNSEKDLMNAIVHGRQEEYVLAQAEALAYLEWLKKFSQAFLDEEV